MIFANYIHAHLQTSCEQSQRLRHYVCPKCHAPKGNPKVLMKKLLHPKRIDLVAADFVQHYEMPASVRANRSGV